MIKITFLGTSSMLPTLERNHTSIFIKYKNHGILVDCGEGTQRQLRKAKISPSRITKLLITHWHGDHVLGIPGLIQNLNANNYKKTLEIYGPRGTKKYLKNLLSGISFQNRVKSKIKEISSGIFYKDKDFLLSSYPLKHIIPCLGYTFQESNKLKINLDYLKNFGLTQHPLLGKLQQGKDIIFKGKKILAEKATIPKPGRKISIVLDTAPCKNAIKLAKNSNILITEATWTSELKAHVEKRKHLTSELAAKIAKKANVKELILTHFSQRYKDLTEIEKEAKKIFKNTKLAEDFLEIQL